MGRVESLEMDMIRIGSQKAVDTMPHNHSSTNMSKSISGASLASSQATQRTKCSSGFSSMGGSIRSAGSSVPHTPGPNSSSLSEHCDAEGAVIPPPRAKGGGNTVLDGVAPTMRGMLRRRARFSGWRAETGYFEVRSTALIGFPSAKSNGGGSHVSLASLAHRIMHPQQHNSKQAGDWNWSVDIAGAERVVELPALSRKGTYAFAVEYGSGRRKTLVLAAGSTEERTKWMQALDHAKHRVLPSDFNPLSVIGEGHFGKVLLVRWNKSSQRRPSYSSCDMSSLTVPRLAEEGSVDLTEAKRGLDSSASGMFSRGTSRCRQLLAVKEVALHKSTSLPGVLNERQILGVLQEHPFVVTLQCAWRRGNFLYYGLDFLPGADLFELFRRQYIKMDLTSARVYGGQIALALEHLHAHGICYRDLKPENILVDERGYLRLADMGLSKVLGVGKDHVRTSTVCGTRAYLAPEMVLRKPYGYSVDFWQFGCFLFELYAGHSPFWTPRSGPPARANDQTVALILAGEISYPRSMEPASKALIRDLLRPEADKRIGCRASGPGSRSGSGSGTDAASGSGSGSGSGSSAEESDSGTDSSTRESGEEDQPGVLGWCEVRSHEFFKDMDWDALLRRELTAPLKPGSLGKGFVGNFAREYTRQRAYWGGDHPDSRDTFERDVLFKRELLGFDFVRHP